MRSRRGCVSAGSRVTTAKRVELEGMGMAGAADAVQGLVFLTRLGQS